MAERVPTDAVARIRHQEVIFTDAYQDDPISFKPDERFEPESMLRQIDSGSVVSRDPANFAIVNINAKSAINYPIPMFSQIYRKTDVDRAIDKTFKQLKNDA